MGDLNKANENFYRTSSRVARGSGTWITDTHSVKTHIKKVSTLALGKSDHAAILLMPTYKQRLKREEPVICDVRRWTFQSEDALDEADWEMFWRRSDDDVNLQCSATSSS